MEKQYTDMINYLLSNDATLSASDIKLLKIVKRLKRKLVVSNLIAAGCMVYLYLLCIGILETKADKEEK